MEPFIWCFYALHDIWFTCNYMQFFFKKVLFQLTYEMRRRPKLEAGFHVADHYALFFKNSCLISESEEQNTHPQSMDYPKFSN